MAAVKPVPFVLVGDDGSFSLNPDACALLERIKGKLVIIAVAGLYRTGKSFLLNLLVRHAKQIDATSSVGESTSSNDDDGFAVGATVNACTKGIWLWGEPLVMEDGTTYLFLDTEGLGSVDREQTHDTRIFALALLLATNFIYNSRGVIDGNAIEDLSLVVNLSKHIQTSSSQNQTSSASSGNNSLHEFFPTFLWVVRDFTLQLLENGKKITSKQYLENALKPTGGYSDDSLAKDQIRSLISDFFRQRDCVTLVRPVDDEQKLRALPKVPYEELRDEFRSAFETLRKRLFDKAKPKMLYGKTINGAMLVNLVKSYVDALNSGKAPVISSAWSRVVQAQCEDALHDSVELYKSEMAARVQAFVSSDQFEQDQARELEGDATRLSVVDFGQGESAMFDENGNLRAVPLASKPPPSGPGGAGLGAADGGDDDSVHTSESEMIQVMENEDRTSSGGGVHAAPVERTRLPCREDTLLTVHRLSKRLAKKKLREVVDNDLASDEPNEYVEQFRVAVQRAFEPFKQANAAASMSYCRHVLTTLSHQSAAYLTPEGLRSHAHKSAMELFRDTQSFLDDDVERVHREYFGRAIGPSADAAYGEFISQRVVAQVIQRTEHCNVAHMSELRDLEKQVNDVSVKVAIAQGQASAMQELSSQQKQKCELGVREAEQRCQSEIASLRATLEFKTNELEHVLTHNATLKRLADTAQQGQYRATEIVSSAMSQVLAGYLIKQQLVQGGGGHHGGGGGGHGGGGGSGSARAKWYQRYFVLQGSQLSFYDTKEDYERARSDNPPMDVVGATVDDQFAIPEAFTLSFAQDKYFPLHLHAKSVEAKREWVDSLRRASGSAAGGATGGGGTGGGGAAGYAGSYSGGGTTSASTSRTASASSSSGGGGGAGYGASAYQPQHQSLAYLQQPSSYHQQHQHQPPPPSYHQQQQPSAYGYQQPPAYGGGAPPPAAPQYQQQQPYAGNGGVGYHHNHGNGGSSGASGGGSGGGSRYVQM